MNLELVLKECNDPAGRAFDLVYNPANLIPPIPYGSEWAKQQEETRRKEKEQRRAKRRDKEDKAYSIIKGLSIVLFMPLWFLYWLLKYSIEE